MPPLDANLEMDPSDISDLDDKVTPIEELPDPAASSPATGETDTELLSVARDAIDKELGKSDAASPADGKVEDPDADLDEPKKQDDENYSDVPFHTHPRFQQLLRKSKANEQDAVRYGNVQTFLRENGLSDGEASDALIIASNMRRDPHKAWEMLKPLVTNLLTVIGEVIPPDLKQRVASGEITQEVAVEISKARGAQLTVEQARAFELQQRESTEHSDFVKSIKDAAANWENQRRIKDPNFADKEVALRKEVLFLQSTDGIPRTPDGVKAQLKKAYDAVNANYRPTAPAPTSRPAVKPVNGGQVAGNQRPDTKTMSTMDIINAHTGG